MADIDLMHAAEDRDLALRLATALEAARLRVRLVTPGSGSGPGSGNEAPRPEPPDRRATLVVWSDAAARHEDIANSAVEARRAGPLVTVIRGEVDPPREVEVDRPIYLPRTLDQTDPFDIQTVVRAIEQAIDRGADRPTQAHPSPPPQPRQPPVARPEPRRQRPPPPRTGRKRPPSPTARRRTARLLPLSLYAVLAAVTVLLLPLLILDTRAGQVTSVVLIAAALVSLFLAVTTRKNAPPWINTHLIYQMRTAWMMILYILLAFAGLILGTIVMRNAIDVQDTELLQFFVMAILIGLAWATLRYVRGFLVALKSRGLHTPHGWL